MNFITNKILLQLEYYCNWSKQKRAGMFWHFNSRQMAGELLVGRLFAFVPAYVIFKRSEGNLNMTNQNTDKLLSALEWRYATKIFDPNKRIPSDTWTTLERALVLTPTSYGLQPYRFLVIQDPAKRAALLPHSWNQKQVVDASHFVVFTARTRMTGADVDKLIRRTSDLRKVPADSLNFYRDMMLGDIVNGPRSKVAREWAARQAYIALGNLMTCAAVLGVDACPMEGFNPAEYDRILGLQGGDYATVVACALGYRAANDKYSNLAKVRYETSELVVKI